MYRLGHGGMPAARAYVIQIGTNDVQTGDTPHAIVEQASGREVGRICRLHMEAAALDTCASRLACCLPTAAHSRHPCTAHATQIKDVVAFVRGHHPTAHIVLLSLFWMDCRVGRCCWA